jgi:glycosyltransferase involved in cell wall biosynthesis
MTSKDNDTAKPLVSVLILTYNAEKFIRESLDSVLSQNYDNLQIVISDDCSADGTTRVLVDYAERHPGVFTLNLNKENVGITRNANLALSLCKGDFVAFHAGDDVMLPGKISKQVDYFMLHPECALCYHNLELFDSDSNKGMGCYNNFRNPARQGSVRELIKHGCFIGGNSVMVRRKNLPPGGYNIAFPVASDWQLWIAVTIDGGQVGYINEVLARYRRHANNTTAIASPLNKQAILDALNTTNWVVVNHPEYSVDALKAYAIHLRLLRRLNGGKSYSRALLASLKVWPTLAALVALALHTFTLGSSKK